MALPHPGIELGSPAWQADSLPNELSGKPHLSLFNHCCLQLKNPISIFLSILFHWSVYLSVTSSTLSGLFRASPVAQLVENPPAMQKTWLQSLVWEDPLEKGKATHSSILA